MSKTKMLSLVQEREYNRDVELREYLLQNEKEYEAYVPFSKVVQLFIGNMDKVEPLIPVKGKKGIIITQRKNNIRASLATNVNVVCKAGTEYAISTGDTDLQEAVRFRASDITNAKDGNITAIITTITGALTPLLSNPAFIEYQITAGMLTTLTELAAAFNDTCGKAAVVDTNSSIANSSLNQIFKAIRSNIASLRRLLTHFNITNPNFVEGFNKHAAVNYTGIRHSGIEGIVTNPLTGLPVEGAIITGEGKKKIAKTDKKGYYKLIKLQITDMRITVTATGYDAQVFDVKILRGHILECNVSLRAKVIKLSATA